MSELSNVQKGILQALEEGPATVTTIQKRIRERGKNPLSLTLVMVLGGLYVETRRLVELGHLDCTVTPPTAARGDRPGYIYSLKK